MAADNHTTIVGNLVEDPELRFTNNGIVTGQHTTAPAAEGPRSAGAFASMSLRCLYAGIERTPKSRQALQPPRRDPIEADYDPGRGVRIHALHSTRRTRASRPGRTPGSTGRLGSRASWTKRLTL
jgi:hypothetical protein